MRILELEIKNIRGITDLEIKPEGNNFVIWGPNGSGKSAVVDAIDFLLTGQITRLTGEGTQDITLKKHGPHIESDPRDAIVRALIKVSGKDDPIEIKRCMAKPRILEMEESFEPYVIPILEIAKTGQHVLTRREILKFITSEANTRSKQIQELLNIKELESIRRTLVKVKNEAENSLNLSKNEIENDKNKISATIQEITFDKQKLLEKVNNYRRILGGSSISEINSKNLKDGIVAHTAKIEKRYTNITFLDNYLKNLVDILTIENKDKISKYDEKLRKLIEYIRSNQEFKKVLNQKKLTENGLKLIDDAGNCPLCDKEWPPGELKKYLEQKLEKIEFVSEQTDEIEKLSSSIIDTIKKILVNIDAIIPIIVLVSLKREQSIFYKWSYDLKELNNALENSLEKYPGPNFTNELVKNLFLPDNFNNIADNIRNAVKSKFPDATPEQEAWDTLTRLEENIKALEKSEIIHKNNEVTFCRADKLLECFQNARDSILTKLYGNIRDRFVKLYSFIHKSDEENFKADIRPEGPGITFKVGFYEYGEHPPHALHSEGHQDSMGICLFLALSEELTQNLIDLVILDDVIMSVDNDHRKEICDLFKRMFPNTQFLITTHDKTWTNQLRYEGLVPSKNVVEFFNWNVKTGPLVNYEVDMWEKIELDIQRNDISNAAYRLRRGSEEFFSMVCDALKSAITYKLNAKYVLGDWLPSAMGQYSKLLNKAVDTANSWNDKESLDKLEEHKSIVKSVFQRVNVEQWAINPNVHYNNWANFSNNDFRSVVEAFQDLFGLFLCQNCGSILYVTLKESKLESVRCGCSKLNWNLIKKT